MNANNNKGNQTMNNNTARKAKEFHCRNHSEVKAVALHEYAGSLCQKCLDLQNELEAYEAGDQK